MMLIFFFLTTLFAQDLRLSESMGISMKQELTPFYDVSSGHVEAMRQGEVVSVGTVDNPSDTTQRLMMFVAGIHPRNCTLAMRKLSLYENYHNYMDFIKTSTYDDKTQKFSFTIDHALLPFPMIVGFKIPRIRKEGHYPFVFEDGFLKNLKGTVIVKEVGKYCLLGLKTDWQGPVTKIPSIVFGTFAQTVGKLGLEHLIRVSRF
jgi:hypothetical protein